MAAGDSIQGSGCGCAAAMCLVCWKAYYISKRASTTRDGIRTISIAISCPMCGVNILALLSAMFPHAGPTFATELPDSVAEAWVTEIRGGSPKITREGLGRACGLCFMATEPPHTRTTCSYRAQRRQFLQNNIDSETEILEGININLEATRRRISKAERDMVQAEQDLADASEDNGLYAIQARDATAFIAARTLEVAEYFV